MRSLKGYALTLLVAFGLLACGGGNDDKDTDGYSGAIGDAVITADKGDDLTLAAVSGVRGALADASVPAGIPGSAPREAGIDWPRLAARTAQEPVPNVCSSGSVDVTDTSNGGTAGTVTIVFNQCTMTEEGETFTLDGTMVFVNNSDGSFSVTIDNMTVTASWGSETIVHYEMACDASYNCSWTTDLQGLDGRTYRVQDADVYQVNGGVNGSLTVYDPDNGKIKVTVSGLVFDCAAGMPSAGTLVLTGASGQTATVTFTGCDGFTVTVDGVTTPYTWSEVLNG